MAKARKDNKGRTLRRGEVQRQDGLYSYAYMNPFGKRSYIYAPDLLELRKKEEHLQRDQLDGLTTYAEGKADLNFVFDRYISTKTELRQTTYTNYKYMYDRFVRDEFGKIPIVKIKYSDVLYFYFHLLNERGIQINTLEIIHTVLHPTFQLAVRDDIIRKNPSDGVMAELKKKRKDQNGVRHALTVDQQQAFMGFLSGDSPYRRWYPLFSVLLGTGMRIGECLGLRWDDLDMDSRMISVNHSLIYYSRESESGKSECRFKVSLPKTKAGIRSIPMMPQVHEAFREEYEWQNIFGFNKAVVDGMSGFVFTNRFGTVHNPQAVNRAIRRISESYNADELLKAAKEKREPVLLPHFSCHHLRHTFCTRFCEHENNIKVIQSVMGHASIETTMDIYADVTEQKKREAMDDLYKNMKIF